MGSNPIFIIIGKISYNIIFCQGIYQCGLSTLGVEGCGFKSHFPEIDFWENLRKNKFTFLQSITKNYDFRF